MTDSPQATAEDRLMDRGRRKYVGHKKIAQFHGLDMDDPTCMGCGEGLEHWRKCERAHVIARHLGGLDGVQNLWLLCRHCHRGCKIRGWPPMPDFAPGQEQAAAVWLTAHPTWTQGMAHMVKSIKAIVDASGENLKLALEATLGNSSSAALQVHQSAIAEHDDD